MSFWWVILHVPSCVTPMWIYGPDASSCVLISVPDLDYTSTQECHLIAYHAGSISHLTYYLFAQITKTHFSHTHHPASDLKKPRLDCRMYKDWVWFSISHLSCKQTWSSDFPFRCFLASVTAVHRIVCWRLIAHTTESTPHRWQRDDVKVLGITLVNSRGIGVHSEMSDLDGNECDPKTHRIQPLSHSQSNELCFHQNLICVYTFITMPSLDEQT